MFTSNGASALVGFYVVVFPLCRLVEIFFSSFSFLYRVMRGKDDRWGLLQKSFHDDYRHGIITKL